MLALRTFEGLALDLTPGTTISLEQNNPLLADAGDNGSYTLPFTVPRSPANQQALGFPELLDNVRGQARRLEQVSLFDDGRYLLSGTLTLLRITPTSYELSLLLGISAVMAKLKAVKLRELVLGGPRVMVASISPLSFPYYLRAHMLDVVANPTQYDYIFAPVSNCDALADWEDGVPRHPNFNCWLPAGGTLGNSQEGFILHTGSFAPGAGAVGGTLGFPGFFAQFAQVCVPFPRLAYVVRTMLHELRIPFEEDVFDAEMEQLYIIGNHLAHDRRSLSDRDGYAPLAGDDGTFSLAQVLPEMTCAELLRKLADTFYLDMSVGPDGLLRLRRTGPQLALPPVVQLTRQAVPGFKVDLNEETGLTTTYHTGDDKIAGIYYQLPDPMQVAAAVPTVADLPATPGVTHEVRLVQAENSYYQHDGTQWKFFSQNLPDVQLGPVTDNPTTVEQGIDLLLELELPPLVVLPIPGVVVPTTTPATPVTYPAVSPEILRVPTFGARSYAPSLNCLDRSTALRLAFYRGLQPYKDATMPGSYPMLTAGTTNLQGTVLGSYSLRLAGEEGTVARWGQALLALRANPQTVTWPVWLSEEQFYHLDTARKVDIDGLHFVVRKISLTFPLRQPAELELVLAPPAFSPV
ncbi:MAG: hypothetical protein ACRYFX_04665 [Janthinobacterium lividum]